MSGHAPACWVIGNPENRRIALFQDALQQAGLQPAQVIPYRALFDEGFALLDRIAPGSMLRIESPGENFEVEKRILALGGVAGAMQLEAELGRIHHPGAWYAGFSRLMEAVLQRARDVLWFNHPTDILTMFDKPRCKALLAPHTLAPCPLPGLCHVCGIFRLCDATGAAAFFYQAQLQLLGFRHCGL